MRDRTHARLDALLDGELVQGEEAQARAHVAACAECRATLAGVRALDAALREPVPAVPAGFAAAARERALRRRLPEAPLWWLALPVPLRAGATVLLLLAALAGARLGDAVAARHLETVELAAALDTPATDAMTASTGREDRR
jgi:anti-sigma factor RsiW